MDRKTSAKKPASRKTPAQRPQKTAAAVAPPPPGSFPIVGVGASAGGLEAFTALLKGIPPRTGMAFVLVQHLAPKHESILASLLARNTAMPVLEAEEGTKVEPDHVYVIPPARDLVLRDGRLGLTPRPDRATAAHMPIDLFLRTLAEVHDDMAVGVILSGTGTDGTLGIRAIKQAGGIVIAQDPESARYDGMPRSAIVSGEVDYVLPPQGIGAELVRLAELPAPLRVSPPAPPPPEDEDPFRAVLGMVRRSTGADFSSYRQTTLLRRLRRRMVVRKVETLAEYRRLLEGDADEVQALHQDLLINVTSFFRDPETFAVLAEKVFPEVLAGRPADQPVRIWVPGCSTGEEVYSLAIALLESAAVLGVHPVIQMFGTDISDKSIERARAGIFLENIAQDVSPERLQRFFARVDGHFQVSKALRDFCIFAKQDVTRDPPFSRLDLVSCRNMLIYLEPSLQRRVISAFHYSLARGGYLLLGGSETVGPANDLFRVVDREHKLYARKAALAPPLHDLLSPGIIPAQTPGGVGRALPLPAPAAVRGELQREGQRLLLARFGPPSVLVDANFDALEFSGDLEPFLRHKPGDASLHLPKLVRQGLLADVRQVLQDAKRSSAAARRDGIRFQHGNSSRRLSVQALPIKVPGGGETGFLVVFELSGKTRAAAPAEPRPKTARKRDRVIADLEEELAATRSHLQATIEEQEAINEELQSANEEILSSNEELQSINEELETAKEELQSGNEELTTVNDELNNRNAELSRMTDDLGNLLESVDLPIAMVSQDLLLRRFTAPASRLLNLLPGDLGRPFGDIRSNLVDVDLPALVKEAVVSEQTRQHLVRASDGRSYSLLVRPSRTREKRNDGAVLVFIDITELERRAREIENSLDRERAAKHHAEQVGRLKEDFVATVSHELRGPLNAMVGWLHILREDKGEPKTAAAAVAGLDHAIQHQLSLITDLLDFSRIEAGKLRLNVAPILLLQVVETALGAARGPADAKAIKLELSKHTEDQVVLGDGARLQQVLWNLLSNAIKFTPRGGEINVDVGRQGTHIEIAVRDTGRGIKPEVLPHIFERLRQGESSSGRSEGGLGLGLSIVRQLVEMHGGDVRAESEGPGAGSTFTVALPLSPLDLDLSVGRKTAGPSPSIAGLRVLVVENDAEGRDLLSRLLEQRGATAVTAASGAEATKVLDDQPVDLILSDIGMPDEDGYELMRRIRTRDSGAERRTPAIALTAYVGRADRKKALAAGFDEHLSKPISPEVLVATIAKLAGS